MVQRLNRYTKRPKTQAFIIAQQHSREMLERAMAKDLLELWHFKGKAGVDNRSRSEWLVEALRRTEKDFSTGSSERIRQWMRVLQNEADSINQAPINQPPKETKD
jgi:hypothetical protein